MRRLMITFVGIGDLVIMIPLFRKLAEQGELHLLSRPYAPPLFQGQSFMAATHGLAHPNWGRNPVTSRILGRHRLALGRELAGMGYDEIIVYTQERAVITDWVDSWRGRAELRRMAYPELAPDRLRIGLESLGIDAAGMEPAPRLEVSATDRAAARERLRGVGAGIRDAGSGMQDTRGRAAAAVQPLSRIVAVQTGAGHGNARLRRPNPRALSAAQWAGLLTRILELDQADAFVFHGAADQADAVAPIMAQMPARFRAQVHNWAGRAGIAELRALLAESYALISVNTGPAHIAAALGCPLLAFFGPADPAAYMMTGPGSVEAVVGSAPCQFCMGTPRIRACRDNVCMQSLTLDQMMAGWRRLQRTA